MALNLFGNIYAGRRVLVTGHTGFKGSWLALWLRSMNARVAGLALAPNTLPSHWTSLELEGIADHRVDLRDAEAVRRVFDAHRPEIVFHLAAQPLVRHSYRDPAGTFDTNVMGLVNLFEAARNCSSVRVLVNATTDKVYADRTSPNGYRETDALGGHDPYSSSKACAELVTDCYRKSFFAVGDNHGSPVRIATARAGNVIGGGDWADDRLVPDLVRAATSGKSLMIRNPAAVRPWQHVLEPLSGYLRLGQMLWDNADLAGPWNFGPGASGEISVHSLTTQLSAHWPVLHVEHDQTPHPHEAAILRLNCDKARRQLAWQPVWGIDATLARTAAWYRCFYESGQVDSTADLVAYVDAARRLGLEWAA
ncbi:CDP-glucose 4,6-dehydratase [Frateuria sp. Soil773]|uniref:CDP-glucose 4,6-dehydratase n=1 Tax=Frateuria sp. Soil773 TaxID=1736407 RepID=UPI000AB6B508|nr:CDP-glucose 4,6-dehydratase [Frateuria sp. Soil773]